MPNRRRPHAPEMQPAPRARACRVGLPALVAALQLGACGGANEALYAIKLVGPPDAFTGAATASLYVDDREVAKTAVNGTMPFSLEASGLSPTEQPKAVFTVRAHNAAGALVAYGQAPAVEVLPIAQEITIFVQRPGTFGRSTDFPVKLRNQAVFTAETQPLVSVEYQMSAPVFIGGETVVKDPTTGQFVADTFSPTMYVYNPLSHIVEKVADLPDARSEAMAFPREIGTNFLFGGFVLPTATARPDANPMLAASNRLDLYVVGRDVFKKFVYPMSATPVMGEASTARAGAVLASVSAGKVVMLGGFASYTDRAPTNAVAVFDENPDGVYAVRTPTTPAPPPATTPIAVTMLAARSGHTASVDTATRKDVAPLGTVLIYGGGPVGAPIAELLNPANMVFTPFTWAPADPMLAPSKPEGSRRNHQAVVLPVRTGTGAARILILGGLDEAGAPRADSVLCIPSAPSCEPGKITLATPRANFAAFVINNDLVVVGGTGPGGAPVDNAEIFAADSLDPVGVVPVVARSDVKITRMSNLSAAITGGTLADGDVATAIEIYQPRRQL